MVATRSHGKKRQEAAMRQEFMAAVTKEDIAEVLRVRRMLEGTITKRGETARRAANDFVD